MRSRRVWPALHGSASRAETPPKGCIRDSTPLQGRCLARRNARPSGRKQPALKRRRRTCERTNVECGPKNLAAVCRGGPEWPPFPCVRRSRMERRRPAGRGACRFLDPPLVSFKLLTSCSSHLNGSPQRPFSGGRGSTRAAPASRPAMSERSEPNGSPGEPAMSERRESNGSPSLNR